MYCKKAFFSNYNVIVKHVLNGYLGIFILSFRRNDAVRDIKAT